jgi:hypothetical protein
MCVASAVPMGAALAQQSTLSLEAGAVRVRFADQGEFSAATLSPSLVVQSTHLAARLFGSASQLSAGRWSTQGTAVFTAFTSPSVRGFVGETGVALGGSAFPDGARTAQALGSARLHWLGAPVATWIGGALGSMNDGVVWRSVRQAELGASVPLRTASLTVMATPSITDDTLRYTDVLAALGGSSGVFDLSASVGGRLGAALPIVGGDQRVWGGVSVAAWIAPRVAVTVASGTYPVDVTQGFPAGRYISAGMRVGAMRSVRAVEGARARRISREARAAGVAAFALQRREGSVFEVRVRAPRAQEVLVNGDVTGWRPIALVRDRDGWWRGRLVISAATAELVVRVDGGPWLVPPGAEEVVDEFGGRSGRLVVPES